MSMCRTKSNGVVESWGILWGLVLLLALGAVPVRAGQIGWIEYGPYGWTNVGSGLGNAGLGLLHDGTNLYACGYFTNAGAVAAGYVAKWNGTSWASLGGGLRTNGASSFADVIAWDGANLYVGGNFICDLSVGAATNIAMWNGASWTNMGAGFSSQVLGLLHDGTNLYACGPFTESGATTSTVMRWTGTAWTNVGTLGAKEPSSSGGFSHDMTKMGADLFVAASTDYNSVVSTFVAKWTGTTWTNIGTGNNTIRTLANDGTNLYAGGWFTNINGVAANHIAKWDGTNWTNLGSGVDGIVYDLYHDGTNLFAGGTFTNAGGVVANHIAKWNGTSWTNIGSGMNGFAVTAILPVGANIYAGGLFSTAGVCAADNIAQWAPASVTEHSGVEPDSGSVTGGYQVVITGSDLGNGSDITNVTLRGVSVSSIVSQSATQIVVIAGATVTPGLGDVVVYSTNYGQTEKPNAFTYLVLGPAILVTGPSFGYAPMGAVVTNIYTVTNSGTETLHITSVTNSGPGAAYYLAQMPEYVAPGTASNFPVVFSPGAVGALAATGHVANNSAVADYPFALSGTGYGISSHSGPFPGGNVITITNGYFGTTITNVLIGGVAATLVDSGTDWVTVIVPAVGSTGPKDVIIQTSDNGDTTLPGAYTVNPAGQIGGTVVGGYGWTNVGSGLGNAGTGLLHDGTNLYVCGFFTNAGAVAAGNVAKWNGTSWASLGGGLRTNGASSVANALDWDGANLYVGGKFICDLPVGAATNVAMWNGASWTNLGAGFSSEVLGLLRDGTNLYACGSSFKIGQATSVVARWTGTVWTNVGTLGPQAGANGYEMTKMGADLFVAAATNYSSVTRYIVAKWIGTAWTNIGTGNDWIARLANDGTNLYAGGWFTNINGVAANHIAKWNGTSWTNLGSGVDGYVYELYHDGTNLFAGGTFTNAGGVVANHIAKWNGTSWTNIGSGMNGFAVTAILPVGANIYAGGLFSTAGVCAAANIAQWVPATTEFSGVEPDSGPATGGYQVVITGSNLGNGGDITNVTLCGVSVASIVSQSATQIVVIAGATVTPGLGDVRVFSASYGEIAKPDAFTYIAVATSTITFDSAGGSAVAPITQAEGTVIARPSDPTRAGYTFAGWVPDIPATMPADDVTCVAQWSVNTYLAIFYVDGAVYETVPTDFGAAIQPPDDPLKEGYTFTGWNPVPGVMGAANETFNAQFSIKTYQITFDANGGTGGEVQTVDHGTVPTPPAVTRAGYIFTGWSPAVGAATEDQTYTAQWAATSTITFDSAGGSAVAPITQAEGTAVARPADPTRTGYTFSGWVPDIPATMPADDVTCVAQWSVNTYNAFFYVDGVLYETAPTEFGAAIQPPDDPVKPGYTFTGWDPVPGVMGAGNETFNAQFAPQKADQAITSFLPTNGSVFFTTDQVGLSALATSGLPVSFATNGGPGVITGGTNLAFTGFGQVVVVASQPGDDDWNPAPSVTNIYTVHGVPVVGPITVFRATNNLNLKIPQPHFLTNAVDPEGTAMTVFWASPASTNGGTVTNVGYWTKYVPPPGDDTPDYFQFRVRNIFGAVAEGTAEVIVFDPAMNGTLNISSLVPSASNTLIRFVGIPGRNYDVQSTTNLLHTPWLKIGDITIGGLGYVVFTDTNEPVGQFYRAARPE